MREWNGRRTAAAIRRITCCLIGAAALLGGLAACSGSLPVATETPAEIPLTASPTKKPTATPKSTATRTIIPTDIVVPEILCAGTFTLTTRNYEMTERNAFDLDRGIHTGGKEADLHYTMGCGSQCFDYFDTVNGATSYDIGDQPAEIATCIRHRRDFSTDGLTGWGMHNFFCILTNGGNMALVTVADQPEDHNWTLRLNFLTWDMDLPG